MKFTKPDQLAYWASGGGITSKFGPLSMDTADRLYTFFACQAIKADEIKDREGARYCAQMAIQLFKAIEQANRWARAA
jgi:hypothetical protein